MKLGELSAAGRIPGKRIAVGGGAEYYLKWQCARGDAIPNFDERVCVSVSLSLSLSLFLSLENNYVRVEKN